MRVIAGEFRSRRLKSLEGMQTRPTPDRLRESLFNILAPTLEGKTFLDAYAGTGAVGIEALSRGAKRVIFIEKNREAATVIRENLTTLGAAARAEVLHGRVLQYLPHRDADIIFLDPPYDLEHEYAEGMKILGTREQRLVVVQHSSRFALQDTYERLSRKRIVKQGDNSLSFFSSLDDAHDE